MKGFGKTTSRSLVLHQEIKKIFSKFNKRGNTRRKLPAIAEAAKIEAREPSPERLPETLQSELEHSAIDPEIAILNFKSLSGNAAFDYLIYSDKISRRNDGRLRDGEMRRYAHLFDGGWWCSGINVITWEEDSRWGCFKPNTPRMDVDKGKPIKYEQPPKVDTEIFALRVPGRIWQAISSRYDVALPENYQNLSYSDFWRWVKENPQIPIILVEGAKKAAAVLSCGYVAIALPGVWGGYRQPKNEYGEADGAPYLIPQLAVFAHQGRRIYFCFDADTKRTTVRNVNYALTKTAKLLSLCGCNDIRIMCWHSAWGKGIDDVLSSLGREQLDKIYRNALSFEEWTTKQLKRLTYEPDLTLDQCYLGEIAIPANKQLIAIKSPKGTGKTFFFERITDPVIRSGEKKVLVITHRVQLGTQIVERLGLPFVTQVKDIAQGSLFGMGLCIDSLHPKSQAHFNPDQWKGCWIILDEIQQLIWHLLSSSTCEKNRVIIIKTFQKLLLNVINYGGKIFVADADLNDTAIDFVKGLIGQDVDSFIVENTFKFNEPWQLNLIKSKNPALLLKLLQQKLAAGEKHLLCCSGQKAKSKYGSRNLESEFKKLYPELRILRIDSETVADPAHSAFGCVVNLNEIVKDYDLVICTPTIETGVSIEEKHFDGVWGIFQGVQTTDSVRQHLSRYRPPVPRYIWLSKVGINRVGNGAKTAKGLLTGEYKKDKVNLKKLIDLGFEEDIDGNFNNVCINTWAKLGAIINDGMSKYSEQIVNDLEDEGHISCEPDTEVLPSPSEVENMAREIAENCKEEYGNYCEQVSASHSITDEDFLQLDQQAVKTEQERLEYRKGELERRYNIPITPDIVEKDDKKFYSYLRLHYYLDKGRNFLPNRDKNVFLSALKNGNGDYFIPDSNKKLISTKIEILDYLEFNKLIQAEEISNTHELAINLFEKVKKSSGDLKLLLEIDFSKVKTPIEACQRLLAMIGFKLPLLRKQGKRGQQVRIYGTPSPNFQKDDEGKLILVDGRAIPVSDRREEVFRAWLERDILAREKAAAPKLEAQAAAKVAVVDYTTDEWLTDDNLVYIAETLEACESVEMLADLRKSYPPYALKSASKRLDKSKLVQIKEWVSQLNNEVA
jgi:hypothetical protein